MAGLNEVLRRPRVQGWIAGLAALYIRLVHASSRWPSEGREHLEALWRDGQPFIIAFWHGRLLMMPCAWGSDRPLHVLISQHRDGELIARAIQHFGLKTLRGSTDRRDKDKGGGSALRGLLRTLRAGESVCITPDGPKGPRMRAAPGIVVLARLANVPIVPVAYSAVRGRLASSWDRFLVPYPFNRGLFLIGAPIPPPDADDEASTEAARRDVEDALNRLNAEADARCRRPAVEPASEIVDARA